MTDYCIVFLAGTISGNWFFLSEGISVHEETCRNYARYAGSSAGMDISSFNCVLYKLFKTSQNHPQTLLRREVV